MNEMELRAELARQGYTIPSFSQAIGISKKAGYEKVKGITNFTQPELAKAKQVLSLTDQRFLSIFFDDIVS